MVLARAALNKKVGAAGFSRYRDRVCDSYSNEMELLWFQYEVVPRYLIIRPLKKTVIWLRSLGGFFVFWNWRNER